jgi:hypothetical protein
MGTESQLDKLQRQQISLQRKQRPAYIPIIDTDSDTDGSLGFQSCFGTKCSVDPSIRTKSKTTHRPIDRLAIIEAACWYEEPYDDGQPPLLLMVVFCWEVEGRGPGSCIEIILFSIRLLLVLPCHCHHHHRGSHHHHPPPRRRRRPTTARTITKTTGCNHRANGTKQER